MVLSLVQDHGLFHIIQDKLLQVAAGDPQRSVLMFVENSDKVRPCVFRFHAIRNLATRACWPRLCPYLNGGVGLLVLFAAPGVRA